MNSNNGMPNKAMGLRAMHLEQMPPNEYVTLNPIEAEQYGDKWIRVKVSQLNSKYGINLRVHRYKEDGSIQIWHDPTPRDKPSQTSVTFERLVKLKQEQAQLAVQVRAEYNPELIQRLLTLQDQIELCLAELRQPLKNAAKKHSGGRLGQPLAVILAHLHINEEEWALLPKTEQTRQWVRAEVEIKQQQREGDQNDSQTYSSLDY